MSEVGPLPSDASGKTHVGRRSPQASLAGGSDSASLAGESDLGEASVKLNEPQGAYTDSEIEEALNALFAEDRFAVAKLRCNGKIVFRPISDDLKDDWVESSARKIVLTLVSERNKDSRILQIYSETDGIALSEK